MMERVSGNVPPDMIVIGAMRAGTTTLYELLHASGQVYVPRMKETDYFLKHQYQRGLKWFNGQFKALDKPICDVSPNYTKRDTFPNVAQRIWDTNPNVLLVFIVRDPVKRAISQYHHQTAMSVDLPEPGQLIGHKNGEHILACSRYAFQLEPYLELFPREQLHIMDFEDLISQQNLALNPLFRRLGLEEMSEPVSDVHSNSATQIQNYPSWWGGVRNSKPVEWVRARAPRSAIKLGKSLMFASTRKPAKLRVFDAEATDSLKQALSEDANRFRQLTGNSYDTWSV